MQLSLMRELARGNSPSLRVGPEQRPKPISWPGPTLWAWVIGPMCEQTVEGECPACGKAVRYTGYVPRIYLCADCGGEKPHADGVVERDGRLFYEPEGDHAA